MARRWLICPVLLLGLVVACTPVDPVDTNRLVVDAGPNLVPSADEEVTLTATANGGTPPYYYRWSLELQPDESTLNLEDPDSDVVVTNRTLTMGLLTENGAYAFRVLVIDSEGRSDFSFAWVTVGGNLAFTASAADALVLVGETTSLNLAIDETQEPENRQIEWTVEQGQATLSDPTVVNPEVTIESAETIQLRATVTAEVDGEGRFGVEDVYIVGIANRNTGVVIENQGAVTGQIVLQLDTQESPKTCANFLRYVDEGFYDGILWHRVVPDFVIQTGAFERGESQITRRRGVRPPVESEAKEIPAGDETTKYNVRSTVSMALRGTDADSGDVQFFINLVDNSENLDVGPPPFTVFARVVEGMDVADEIAATDIGNEQQGFAEAPLEDIVMASVRRITLVSVTASGPAAATTGEPFAVEADVEGAGGNVTYAWRLVSGTADLTNQDQATLTVTPTATGPIQLEVTVTDEDTGRTATDTFEVSAEEPPALTVTPSAEPLLRVEEELPLQVDVGNAGNRRLAYAWQVLEGPGTLTNADTAEPTLTASQGGTIVLEVDVRTVNAPTELRGSSELVVVSYEAEPDEKPQAEIEVEGLGRILLDLEVEASPLTVANFLRYADAAFWDGVVWHRVVPDFVIQAGAFTSDGETLTRKTQDDGVRPPVQGEAPNGLSNVRGTMAMALRGQDNDSGDIQFFINLTDNSASLDVGPPAFTVFATVVSGMESVVDVIGAIETESRSGMDDVPVDDVVIRHIRRLNN
jgi:peptidyl-prolyl cis-trans isomerase A (cyclophilin A)